MTDEQLRLKMLTFLEKHYPVSRIKHNRRFKRGIVLDGGEHVLLNDKGSYLILQVKLEDVLNLVFDTDEKTNLDVLIEFLHLRKQR